jgi:hypothetical protein
MTCELYITKKILIVNRSKTVNLLLTKNIKKTNEEYMLDNSLKAIFCNGTHKKLRRACGWRCSWGYRRREVNELRTTRGGLWGRESRTTDEDGDSA